MVAAKNYHVIRRRVLPRRYSAMTNRSYYERLGVDENATQMEIKTAFIARAKEAFEFHEHQFEQSRLLCISILYSFLVGAS